MDSNSQEEGKYILRFKSAVSPIVLGWMIGMREVKVLRPESAKEKMRELLEKNLY